MVQRKTGEFDARIARAADLARALSHPARIQILQILRSESACICGEIVDRLPLSQSTVSQHLRELKRVGIIKGEVEGPRTCYCLDENVLAGAFRLLNGLLSDICRC